MNKIFTIGFTGKSAENFFSLLKDNNIKKVIDVRLNNNSQLAGFTKKGDFGFFLQKIISCAYIHRPDLAPTDEILKGYKAKTIGWDIYAEEYIKLLVLRDIKSCLNRDDIINAVFLCSEHQPERCHRRLLAEYLQRLFNNFEIIHLT
jgi:uncharacterized protein (DUF488 family)